MAKRKQNISYKLKADEHSLLGNIYYSNLEKLDSRLKSGNMAPYKSMQLRYSTIKGISGGLGGAPDPRVINSTHHHSVMKHPFILLLFLLLLLLLLLLLFISKF